MKEQIISNLRESADLKLRLAKESIEEVEETIKIIQKSLSSGGKVLLFGNGGSAAQAQHIASELINCNLQKKHKAVPAIALTTDTSMLTSMGDSSSFDDIFSRQIEAFGKKGDVAWAISASGKSPNVIKAIETAKALGLKTIGFTGGDGGKIKKLVDCNINVPSTSIPRIQEVHITLAHTICELIENSLCEEKDKQK
ncbi:MAG TPA: SIS domain-containing protein [Thermodesulfobacteriota bacterium]|nr:SIS domain-containing protein [Thermodesulfobacteriota bacterium]